MQNNVLDMTDGTEFLTLFTNKFAQNNPDVFYKVYKQLFINPTRIPNSFHKKIFLFYQHSILKNVVTMNLDNLLEDVGIPNVLNMWGDIEDNSCISCEKRFDSAYIKQSDIPYCDNCKNLILPIFVIRNMVALKSGIDWAKKPNKGYIVACGTKLEHDFNFSDGLIITNNEPTKYDEQADLVINADFNDIFKDLEILFKQYFN